MSKNHTKMRPYYTKKKIHKEKLYRGGLYKEELYRRETII